MIITKKTRPVLPQLSLLALIPLLLLTGWLSGCDSDNDGKTQRPKQEHRVEITVVEVRPIHHQQTISGTLEATTSVRLHNEESGRIAELPYFEGDAVKKGTVVISLVDDLIRAELDKAKAQHAQAAADLKRIKKLLPKKLASEEEVARAQTALSIAKAELNLLLTRLTRSHIKAPFDGVITARKNEPGDAVSSHSHILSMIDPNSLRVKIQISERWIPLIKIRDSVKISIDALGDTLYPGQVSRIHPTIDPKTRKGTLEITLQPVPKAAQAGQLARAQIITQAANRLVVPTLAVQHDMNGAFVYKVLQNDKNKSVAKRSAIEKGAQFGEWVEVLSGASAGDKVITKGFLGLRDNKMVNVIQP